MDLKHQPPTSTFSDTANPIVLVLAFWPLNVAPIGRRAAPFSTGRATA
jgi:hypothetical protein